MSGLQRGATRLNAYDADNNLLASAVIYVGVREFIFVPSEAQVVEGLGPVTFELQHVIVRAQEPFPIDHYSVDDPGIVTITHEGARLYVSYLSEGDTIIRAYNAANEELATITVHAVRYFQSYQFTPESEVVVEGTPEELQFFGVNYLGETEEVTPDSFTIADTTIATVTSDENKATVTYASQGTTTLNAVIDGVTVASADIDTYDLIQSYKFDPASITIEHGTPQTTTFKSVDFYGNEEPFQPDAFEVANTNIVTIASESGVVTVTYGSEGTTTITAKDSEDTVLGTCTVEALQYVYFVPINSDVLRYLDPVELSAFSLVDGVAVPYKPPNGFELEDDSVVSIVSTTDNKVIVEWLLDGTTDIYAMDGTDVKATASLSAKTPTFRIDPATETYNRGGRVEVKALMTVDSVDIDITDDAVFSYGDPGIVGYLSEDGFTYFGEVGTTTIGFTYYDASVTKNISVINPKMGLFTNPYAYSTFMGDTRTISVYEFWQDGTHQELTDFTYTITGTSISVTDQTDNTITVQPESTGSASILISHGTDSFTRRVNITILAATTNPYRIQPQILSKVKGFQGSLELIDVATEQPIDPHYWGLQNLASTETIRMKEQPKGEFSVVNGIPDGTFLYATTDTGSTMAIADIRTYINLDLAYTLSESANDRTFKINMTVGETLDVRTMIAVLGLDSQIQGSITLLAPTDHSIVEATIINANQGRVSLTALSEGTAIIVARLATSIYAVVTINVTSETTPHIEPSKTVYDASVTDTFPLKLVQNGQELQDVTWELDAATTAFTLTDNVLTCVGVGEATITATVDGSTVLTHQIESMRMYTTGTLNASYNTTHTLLTPNLETKDGITQIPMAEGADPHFSWQSNYVPQYGMNNMDGTFTKNNRQASIGDMFYYYNIGGGQIYTTYRVPMNPRSTDGEIEGDTGEEGEEV